MQGVEMICPVQVLVHLSLYTKYSGTSNTRPSQEQPTSILTDEWIYSIISTSMMYDYIHAL